MCREVIVRVLLLSLAVLLQACAVGARASGGLLSPVGLLPAGSQGVVLLHDSGRREPEFADAQRAEAECALAQVWGLVHGVDEVGARVELRFWAHGGALTLLSHRTAGGRERAEPVDEAHFSTRFRRLLSSYVDERTGEVVFTLHRQRADWRVDFRGASDVPRPPEAKTQPVRRHGVSAGTYASVTRMAGEMAHLMGGPSESGASFATTVALDDDGMEGWEPGPHEGTGREMSSSARARLQGELIQALLPFTHGVGRREVRLVLRGTHRPDEAVASWRLVEADTLHPESPGVEDEDLIARYRALHESILREWREEVADSGRLALRIGAEEFALWIIGGVVAHGTGVILQATAPRLMELLLRGGAGVQGWLSNLLRRLPRSERTAFSLLWEKLELRGARSLSQAEERELSRLAKRLEELIAAPLSREEKEELRATARASFQRLHPELAEAMKLGRGGSYEIHHRRPLEYAHLFLGEDINARINLAAVARPVHHRISGLWTKFRNGRGVSQVDAAEVNQMAEIVDRHFQRWYDALHAPQSMSALDQATEAALKDLERLLAKG